MKVLLTLAAFSVFTLTAMAAGRNPSVTIMSSGQFTVVVDGKRIPNGNFIRLDRLNRGKHVIRVYRHRRGFFGRRMHLVSTRRFHVRNSDLRITINRTGSARIVEMRNTGRDNYRKDGRNRNKRLNNTRPGRNTRRF